MNIDFKGKNLTGVTLKGVDLCDGNLESCDLSSADLSSSDLDRTRFVGSNLTKATLIGTSLVDADMRECILKDTVLDSSNLSRVNLEDMDLTSVSLLNADLVEAYLSGCNLSGMYLVETDLRDSTLTEANLSSAQLYETVLSGANLSGADLTNADLTNADLSGANLSDANLSGADLTDADLSDADLSGADLTGAILVRTQFDGCTLCNTKFDYLTDDRVTKEVAKTILDNPEHLDMSDWHSECGTNHCLAGWFITIHPEGKEIEKELDSSANAGLLIGGEYVFDKFWGDKDDVLRWAYLELTGLCDWFWKLPEKQYYLARDPSYLKTLLKESMLELKDEYTYLFKNYGETLLDKVAKILFLEIYG